MLRLSTWLVLVILTTNSAWAVTGGLTLLPAGDTDPDKSYGASFAIGLTVDGGNSWQTTANLNQSVSIRGSLDPDPAHVGGKGDIFVVEWYAGKFTMLTASGAWLPWSGKVPELQPARDDVVLSATQEVIIHSGGIATSGQHRLYIGYLSASSSALIYSTSPAIFDFAPAATSPITYFETDIFSNIVMSKCTLCHVTGGVANASGLHFIKDANQSVANYDIFTAFYRKQSNGYNYVLSKFSSGSSHPGSTQLPLGSADYQKLAAFLDLLDGSSTVKTQTALALFDGVSDQSALDSLRDASLLLAGRLPTSAEVAAVTTGGDSSLKSVLLAQMQGPHFHQFLKDAANDRLLLRGNEDFNIMDDCTTCFPLLNAEYWRLKDKADLAGSSAADRGAVSSFMSQLNYSAVESPLELIAYVVENNKPYSEILTADYDMLTSVVNAVVGGTASFAAGASALEFKPGRIGSYYLRDSTTVLQQVSGAALPRITNPGNTKVSYPHAGVLNSKSFLSRFPTTATNRNRARARWTYYNFLGVDIEALAKRSTDPVALADTNNPTMNNPSCTVCHAVLDPVAGTFQDYFDNGTYKSALNGTDSLDRFYKSATTGPGLYKTGDTWYRDMRAPGFEGVTAPAGNSMAWLASQIVKDPRFAVGTVRFWWPAVMGSELLTAPETVEDQNYQARLSAYEAQQTEIAALAAKFVQSGLSLKTLLADLVLSRWYRAEQLDGKSVTAVQTDARKIASLTGEKLLTPEQLARKTHALTGFNWNAQLDAVTATLLSGLENDYNTFYGGIDSFALKTRARTITPMMSNVAASHALESSCPIVLGDFVRPDAQRLLFGGLSPWMTPLTEAAGTQSITSTGITDFKPATMTVNLQAGAKKIVISELNDACDYASNATQCKANKNLVIASVSILRPNGQTTVLNGSAATFGSCAATGANNSLTLYSSCTAEYAFTADVSGSYTVTASLAAQQTASDPVLAGMNLETNVAPALSTASGATALKNKLVELHNKLLGQTVTVTSPEVLASYDLLLQTWQSRKSTRAEPALLQKALACDWSTDLGFIGTLSYPGNPLQTNGRYNTAAVTTWLTPQAQDALYMKQSWVVVMAYLLSHYDYLHE
jgi:Protein of unknown function (DUF1588)